MHRDIKPSNIHVCRYGRKFDFVKVLDFGLVKLRHDVGDEKTMAQLSVANVMTGTPAFMAPEQVLGEAASDGRTDLYAVGCVAFWLLPGQTVFQGSTRHGRADTARSRRAAAATSRFQCGTALELNAGGERPDEIAKHLGSETKVVRRWLTQTEHSADSE